MNKVSIIIPVYNSEKYIGRCLDSIINQTYKNLEIICLNDGSKDKSIDVLNEYKKKDKRIVIVDKQNEGVSKTRNKGIKIATGDYIMFCDNDDYFDKDYVEIYVKAMLKYDADVIMGGYKRPNSKGKILINYSLKEGKLNKELIKITAPWAKLFKRDYIVKNNIEFLPNNLGEDFYFNIQALIMSEKVYRISYVGYNWYYNEESVSNTTQKSFEKADIFNLLNNIYKRYEESKSLQNNREYIEFNLYTYIVWFLGYSQKKYKYKVISKNYDKLFDWYKEKFPNYKKNKFIGFNKPKDESFKFKIMYFIFNILDKLKMGKILIYLYTRI